VASTESIAKSKLRAELRIMNAVTRAETALNLSPAAAPRRVVSPHDDPSLAATEQLANRLERLAHAVEEENVRVTTPRR
jgi:hypothetical protein